MGGPEKGRFLANFCLLGLGVFGDSLSTLRDGMFGKFTGKEKSDSGLNFSRWNRSFFIVSSKSVSLRGNTLENIPNEGIHDFHGFGGNSSVGMHLFQNLVDVDFEGLITGLLVAALGSGLLCCFGHCWDFRNCSDCLGLAPTLYAFWDFPCNCPTNVLEKISRAIWASFELCRTPRGVAFLESFDFRMNFEKIFTLNFIEQQGPWPVLEISMTRFL